MYERQSNSGDTVEWEPDNTDWAAEALANVSGTGVSSKADAKAQAAVSLGDDDVTARKVREEYASIEAANTA